MKDSGIPWIGEIPEGWKIYRIKYLCIFNPTENSAGNFTSVGYAPMNSIRWKNISTSTIERSKLSSGLTYFEDGDIVMAKVTPCFENGNIAIAENLPNGRAYGSSELFVFRPTNIDTLFMFYALQSEGFKSACCSTMTGTGGLKRISPNYIYGCPMPLPSFSEQKSIADFLDKKCAEIDEMIALQKKIIEELKAYKQSVITEAVTKGLNPDVPMKDSGISWIGKIPEGWEIAQLKRYAKTNNGKEIELELTSEDKNAKPVYGSGGIFKYTNDILYSGEAVLFGRKGTLGKPIYVNSSFWVVDTMYYLTFTKGLLAKYCYYLLIAFDWNPYITQTAIPSVVASEIVACDFPFPITKEEQVSIVDYLDKKCSEIDTLISTKNAKIEELKEYKKSIIYEYVTGKKEVES